MHSNRVGVPWMSLKSYRHLQALKWLIKFITTKFIQWLLIYDRIKQGWGQFRNWNWNLCQFQFQFQELELQRNWIKGIGIGIDKEELKELVQFLFLIVNSFWFFAMFLAESLNQFDLNPFWIQLTKISLDRYIVLYDNLSIKWILHGSYWLHL